MSRERTECACGRQGRFLRPGICAACHKAENRVYDPVAQKRHFDRWYAAQRAAGYPSYDWAARNTKRASGPGLLDDPVPVVDVDRQES